MLAIRRTADKEQIEYMEKLRKVTKEIIKWKYVEIPIIMLVFFVRGYANSVRAWERYLESMCTFDENYGFADGFVFEQSIVAGLAQAVVFTGVAVYVFSIFALGISENRKHWKTALILFIIMCSVGLMYLWFVANFHIPY